MTTERGVFARRVGVAVAIVALAVMLAALLWAAAGVLLLLFAAILVACLLRGLADLLIARTRLSAGWALAIVVSLLLLFLAAGVALLAPHVASQVDDLSRGLGQSIQQVYAQLSHYEWGKRLIKQTPGVMELARRGDIVSRVTGIFSSTLGVLANTVIVLFIGFYLAVAPDVYTSGIVALFPPQRRERIREVMSAIAQTLRRWLVGRAFLMLSNGIFTTVGLWLLGMPLAVTLGTVAGLLNFVPNIGPIIAGVPAVLIAWTLGPTTALYVLLLYVFLQSIDGYVFTPLVQERTVSLPPALTITAQLLFGVLAGTIGLLFATPLTAAALVLVRMLYVEDVLGDKG